MRQYMKIKNENPDCIVFFRMGDFYETFFEDAKTVSRELEITLTKRGKGETTAPLAGVPYHSVEPYVAKLIKKGYKVAIVEQTEDPKKAKGLVKRDLMRIITPGTVFETLILEESKNNYLLSFVRGKQKFAISFCDVSTGEFLSTELDHQQFLNELKRLNPAEIIFPMSLEESELVKNLKGNNYILHPFDDRFFYNEKAASILKEHFSVLNLKGFGITSDLITNSAGALLGYVEQTQKTKLSHIDKPKQYALNNSMYLDNSTIRNLELFRNIITQKEETTLFSVLDKTSTSIGKRLLRKWLLSPLIGKQQIQKRLNAVQELKEKIVLREELKQTLNNIYDIERLNAKVSFGNANPKDLVSLKQSLSEIPKIKKILSTANSELLKDIYNIHNLSEPERIIQIAIKDNPNIVIREGNIIRNDYNKELDKLRNIAHNTKKYLAELEEKEKKRTGIKSLKIRYNKVFGYYIEVTKSNLHLVPKDYIRKQTQVNSERFITEELKEKESMILGAEERIFALEYELFIDVLEKLKKYINDIKDASKKLAILDCIISFSTIAEKNNYCKPEFNENGMLYIEDGRHTVVQVFSDVDFVPNSCNLDSENRTMIITGPNMAGKSVYMRQVVLICLMAQLGSFVPAKKANLPIFDRIFTRVGAFDDIVSGQSTFLTEMNETANILNNATENSLIILDEIGRGTSTYDGVSLAFAIAEYIHTKIKAKTLFATHYHYLNSLAKKHNGIKNYNIAVEEKDDKIIFLRKIMQGGTDKSYGIQVARLAGIPEEVINKSKGIMEQLENNDKIMEDYIPEKVDKSEKSIKINKEQATSLNRFF